MMPVALTELEERVERLLERRRTAWTETPSFENEALLHDLANQAEHIPYLLRELASAIAAKNALQAHLDSPELHDFTAAVVREAAHQRARWGSEHDDGKTPADWFWLIGYLAGKALHAHVLGDIKKALHHTISSAASLANWHAAILGKTTMRPGIETPDV